MGKRTKSSTQSKSKNTDSSRLDLAGVPPWYLLTHSHGTDDQSVCSRLYIYGATAQFGPDYTVSVKYNPSSDNILEEPEITVQPHAY